MRTLVTVWIPRARYPNLLHFFVGKRFSRWVRSNWRVKILGWIRINPLCVVAETKECPQFLKSLLSSGIAMWPLCTKLTQQFQSDVGDEADAALTHER